MIDQPLARSVEALDILLLEGLLRHEVISQMRGLLLDRGIAIAVSATRARRLIPKILAIPNAELTPMVREIVSSLYCGAIIFTQRPSFSNWRCQ